MKRCLLVLMLLLVSHVGWTAEAVSVKVEKLAETEKSWDGSILPPYVSGQPKVTVLRITIPPRAALDWHRHPVINVGYMLAGSLVVEKQGSGEKITIRAGDVLPELVDITHRGFNPADEPAVILVFYAGVVGSELSKK